ncbi:hypothetical protein [Candidatus Phytoplasma sacchari]|nr:hypothetical protein [Candidatus Phytoplasma sacchari]KAB8122236.1 hypothetical protein F2B49_01650 [Candidatus Phytoplasma sacchari]
MLKNFFIKKFKILLFPKIFNSISKDECFFKKDEFFLNGEKINIVFFYLHQTEYYNYFLDMKQYVVWTIKDNICRVFIEKEYYQKFEEFYEKEINIIYANFLYNLLKKRIYLIYTNILYCLNFSFLSLILFFLFKNLFFLEKLLFFLSFSFVVLLFIFIIFFMIKKQIKIFYDFKKDILRETIEKTELFLGKEKFKNILKQQKSFFIK